jgi:endoglucanase
MIAKTLNMRRKRLQKRNQFHTKFHRIFHIIRNRYLLLPEICLAAFLCVGCGFETDGQVWEGNASGVAGKVTSMESTPIVDYVVPQLFPNVLVDVTGYQADGSKWAVVRGRQLPETFQLVDAQTRETVFVGRLEDVEYSAEQGVYSAYADFHDWNQEGSYYLECEYVGRSYVFTLEDGLYERLFGEACEEMEAACRQQTVAADDIEELLIICEWYGEIVPDGDGDGVPDLLEAVADWIEATGDQTVASGQEATYAAALAKFSYLYQKYDRQYATECLKRASVVFEQNLSVLQKDAECFHALTELYRATGLDTYKNQIAEYRTYFENHDIYGEESGYLYGAMTYMATRQSVDTELCKLFMDALMEQGESVSGLYREMIHPVTARNNGSTDLLWHASELACANYVMNSYQYNQIMEEFLHYLRGRNAQSVDFYVTDTGERAGYLILLAQLVAVQGSFGE